MKARVETRDLRQARGNARGEADDRQRRWHVQRRKGDGRLEFSRTASSMQAMLPELRTAMHDAMPDGVRRRHLEVGKQSADADDRVSLAGNGRCLGEATNFRASSAWNLPPLSPIDSASPAISNSACEGPTR